MSTKVFTIKEQWQFDEFINALISGEDDLRAVMMYNRKDPFVLKKKVDVDSVKVSIENEANELSLIEIKDDGQFVFNNCDVNISDVEFTSSVKGVLNKPIIELKKSKLNMYNINANFPDTQGVQFVVASNMIHIYAHNMEITFGETDGVSRAFSLANCGNAVLLGAMRVQNGENVLHVADVGTEEATSVDVFMTTAWNQTVPFFFNGKELNIRDSFFSTNKEDRPLVRTRANLKVDLYNSRIIGVYSKDNYILDGNNITEVTMDIDECTIEDYMVATEDTKKLNLSISKSRLRLSSSPKYLITINDGRLGCYTSSLAADNLFDIKAGEMTVISGNNLNTYSNGISNNITVSDACPVIFVDNSITVTGGGEFNINADNAIICTNNVSAYTEEASKDPIHVTGEGYSWQLNMLNRGEYIDQQA